MESGLEEKAAMSKGTNDASFGECNTLKRVETLISDDGILRAAKLSTVLHSCGQLFMDSKGTENTYNLSAPVRQMQAFFSHNWSVPRIYKHLCLVLHFSTRMALCVAYACLMLCCTLTARGLAPSSDAIGMVGVVFTPPLALLTFLFGHNIRAFFRDPMIFLDKCCIHQTNDELKKKGISKLSAFLYRSSTLIICYTDVYLKKLWTVYELASFLAVHSDPASRVRLMPAQLAPAIIVMMLLSWMALATYSFGRYFFPTFPALAFQAVVFIPSGWLVVRIMRAWARTQDKMYRNVYRFDLDHAVCLQAQDREVVEGNVIDLMKHCGFVDSGATRRHALDAFNKLVRQEVPVALVKSIGRVGMRYLHIQLPLLPFTCAYADNWAAQYYVGFRDSTCAVLWFIRCTMFPLVVLPLAFAVLAQACKLWLHLKGWKDFGLCAGVYAIFIMIVPVSNMSAIVPQMASEGDVSPIISIVYVLVYVICLVAVFILYAPTGWLKKEHRLASGRAVSSAKLHKSLSSSRSEDTITYVTSGKTDSRDCAYFGHILEPSASPSHRSLDIGKSPKNACTERSSFTIHVDGAGDAGATEEIGEPNCARKLSETLRAIGSIGRGSPQIDSEQSVHSRIQL